MNIKKPEYVKGEAATIWRRKMIEGGDSLTFADVELLASYCIVAADVARLTVELEGQPQLVDGARGGKVCNPLIGLRSRAMARMESLAKRLWKKTAVAPKQQPKSPLDD